MKYKNEDIKRIIELISDIRDYVQYGQVDEANDALDEIKMILIDECEEE